MSGFLSAGILASDAIPDLGLDHFYWSQGLSSIGPWPDQDGLNDAKVVGGPSLVGGGIGGKQSVEYDGSDDDHEASAVSLGTDSVYTIAAVYKLVSAESNVSFISNGGAFRLNTFNSTLDLIHSGVGATSSGTAIDTDPHVVVATYDGSKAIIDRDGTEIANESLGTPSSASGSFYFASSDGSSEVSNIQLGAVGFEAAAADASRRDEITTELADPFGIPTSI